ncbi:hypothetical protein CDAR_509311 [Caerostris darwini]|uniref:Uncharacterized protein n=1 Tax=Caerostris darwini TaxID=1538125 RepID=A0AAV4N0H7_9ARAC|nr:hypothetical protein CDAR_509311 [Caerostris darwini]
MCHTMVFTSISEKLSCGESNNPIVLGLGNPIVLRLGNPIVLGLGNLIVLGLGNPIAHGRVHQVSTEYLMHSTMSEESIDRAPQLVSDACAPYI